MPKQSTASSRRAKRSSHAQESPIPGEDRVSSSPSSESPSPEQRGAMGSKSETPTKDGEGGKKKKRKSGGTEQQRLRSKKLRAQMKELFNTLGSVLGLHPKETVKVIVASAIDTVEEQAKKILALESALADAQARASLVESSLVDSLPISLPEMPPTSMEGVVPTALATPPRGSSPTSGLKSHSRSPDPSSLPHIPISLPPPGTVIPGFDFAPMFPEYLHASMPPSLATDPVGGSTSPQTTVNPKAIFSPFHLQVDDSGLRVAPVPASTPLSPGNHPTPEQLLELHKLHSIQQLQRLQLLQQQLHVQKEYQAKLSIKEKLARRKSRRKSRHRRRSSSVSSPTSTSSDSGSFSDSLAGVFSSSITLSTSDSDPPAFNSGWGSGSGSGSGSEYYSYDLEVVQVTKPSFAKHVGVSTHADAPTHNDAPTHASAPTQADAPTHAVGATHATDAPSSSTTASPGPSNK